MTQEEYVIDLVTIDIDYHEKALIMAEDTAIEFVQHHKDMLILAEETLKVLNKLK